MYVPTFLPARARRGLRRPLRSGREGRGRAVGVEAPHGAGPRVPSRDSGAGSHKGAARTAGRARRRRAPQPGTARSRALTPGIAGRSYVGYRREASERIRPTPTVSGPATPVATMRRGSHRRDPWLQVAATSRSWRAPVRVENRSPARTSEPIRLPRSNVSAPNERNFLDLSVPSCGDSLPNPD